MTLELTRGQVEAVERLNYNLAEIAEALEKQKAERQYCCKFSRNCHSSPAYFDAVIKKIQFEQKGHIDHVLESQNEFTYIFYTAENPVDIG